MLFKTNKLHIWFGTKCYNETNQIYSVLWSQNSKGLRCNCGPSQLIQVANWDKILICKRISTYAKRRIFTRCVEGSLARNMICWLNNMLQLFVSSHFIYLKCIVHAILLHFCRTHTHSHCFPIVFHTRNKMPSPSPT